MFFKCIFLAREYPLRRRGYFFSSASGCSIGFSGLARTAETTPSTSSRMPLRVSSGGKLCRSRKVYSCQARVSKTISGPRISVGSRWLAIFQHSAPTHEQSTAMASISVINTAGRGPKGRGNPAC